jgi:hypothetical protein
MYFPLTGTRGFVVGLWRMDIPAWQAAERPSRGILTPMARFPNAALGKFGGQKLPYGDGLAQVLHLLPHTSLKIILLFWGCFNY